MSDEIETHLRMSALQFAINNRWDADPHQVLMAADAFYDFLSGKRDAPPAKPKASVVRRKSRKP